MEATNTQAASCSPASSSTPPISTSAAVAISQAFCAVSVRVGFFSAMAAMA